MSLPLTIGTSSANEEFVIDFELLPHLFISYSEEIQMRQFFSSIATAFSPDNNKQWIEFAIALSGSSAANYPLLARQNTRFFFAPNDELNSNLCSKEKFMLALSKEMRDRLGILKKVKEGKWSGKKTFAPMIIFFHDVLQIILSKKKSIGVIFLQLLMMGHKLKMHVVAASSITYRMLLKQLINLNPLAKEKFRKKLGEELCSVSTPLGGELVLTAEDFIFFKEANAMDYHRLYPLPEKTKEAKVVSLAGTKAYLAETLF